MNKSKYKLLLVMV